MEKVKFTQFGTFSVVVLSVVFIPLIIFISIIDHSLTGELIASGIFVFFLFMILLAFRLVITVDQNFVNFKMGIGIIRRKYPLEKLGYCKPVKNNTLYGCGIRMIPNGWLYNVSGIMAIELGFKDKPSIIRIGSNKPEEVSEIINIRMKLLSNDLEKVDNSIITKTSILRKLTIIFSAVFILSFVGYIFFRGYQETGIVYAKDSFYIKGMYGTCVRYQDISKVDTLSHMPHIVFKTNGFALGNICKGNFKLKNDSIVRLYIHSDIHPILFIGCLNDKDIYINFKNRQKTLELYKQIIGVTHLQVVNN